MQTRRRSRSRAAGPVVRTRDGIPSAPGRPGGTAARGQGRRDSPSSWECSSRSPPGRRTHCSGLPSRVCRAVNASRSVLRRTTSAWPSASDSAPATDAFHGYSCTPDPGPRRPRGPRSPAAGEQLPLNQQRCSTRPADRKAGGVDISSMQTSCPCGCRLVSKPSSSVMCAWGAWPRWAWVDGTHTLVSWASGGAIEAADAEQRLQVLFRVVTALKEASGRPGRPR